MSNRIDLTQDELRDTLYDWMTKGYKPQMAVSDDIPNEISEILFAIEHLGLITELKRCYEELDFLKENVLTDDDYWIATCKPDGEGKCRLTIEGYKELMRLVKETQVEIPVYSHGHDELLLYECECGITHEEWLESKN